ncbi:hypothetical protein K431DRAFT_306619 [Polychaeton citri CBS 116435]|uniref:Uncharacterized protein n=1 Tax=Polychaeton citri CBS 116435 TaxID=1314669 RepID=A0A9P4UMC0_9PEZI|nr:hypothetical protein K431DRAFT_306619 [Polychaeton citri CBS 116435]
MPRVHATSLTATAIRYDRRHSNNTWIFDNNNSTIAGDTPGVKFLNKMAGFIDVFKALSVPALIAAVLYLTISFAILPLIRRHRQKYAQYAPIGNISATTTTIRDRVMDFLSRLIIPSLRRRHNVVDGSSDSRRGSNTGEDAEEAFGEEEGERMIGFSLNRRERGVGRGGTWVIAGGDSRSRRERDELDSQRRLSRELEEGFKDSSDEEEDEDDTAAHGSRVQ